MVSYTLPGYYSDKECERIKNVFQGKTYYNIQVEYGGVAHNNQVILMTNIKNATKTELESMVIAFAMSNLREDGK